MGIVSTKRYGRLGNALYMYAAMIGYAKKHGLEYHFPTKTNDQKWNPVYFTNLANPNWVENKEDVVLTEIWNTQQQYQEIPFKEEWRDKQIVLNGYWQSYKFWDFCKENVYNDFGLPYEMNQGVCAIHVRRGDYLKYPTKHPICKEQYYYEAILCFATSFYFKFKVHSDDIAWCKTFFNNENFPRIKFDFSEGKNEIDDLISISNCEHQICSNSTMALWGAELNKNQNKIVIVPDESNWFGIDNSKKMTVKDLYRPEWIRIKY